MFVDQVELNKLRRGSDTLLVSIYKLDIDAPEFIVFVLENSDLVFVYPIGSVLAITQSKIAIGRH